MEVGDVSVSVGPVSGVGAPWSAQMQRLNPTTSAVPSEQIKHQHPASQPSPSASILGLLTATLPPSHKDHALRRPLEHPDIAPAWMGPCKTTGGNFLFVLLRLSRLVHHDERLMCDTIKLQAYK